MVKGVFQVPPRTRAELLNSNIWWSEGVEMLKKGCTYDKGLQFYRRGLRCVDDIWDSTEQNFLSWGVAKRKFKLTNIEATDWEVLTNTIAAQWRPLLETEEDTAYAGQWLGLYEDGSEDLTLVFNCIDNFTPVCLQWHNVTLSLSVQCFTVGTHLRCLREWDRPLGEIEGYFHKVKVIHTTRGPKREEKKRKSCSSMAKSLPSSGTRTGGGGWTVVIFLTTLPRMAGTSLAIGIRAPRGRRKNGKGISREIIGFIGRKFGTPFGPGKKPCSFGLYGIRQWQ